MLTRLYVVKLNRRQKIVQMNQRLEKISKNIHIHKPWSWFGFTLCSYCPLQGSPDSIGFIYSWSGLSTLQFGFDHKIDKKEHSSPRRWKKCQEVIKSFSPPVLLKGEPNSEVNSATAICLPHKTMQTNLKLRSYTKGNLPFHAWSATRTFCPVLAALQDLSRSRPCRVSFEG